MAALQARIAAIPSRMLAVAAHAAAATAVRETVQDSGNAAYQWAIGNVKYTPMYGVPPVGAKYSKGINSHLVLAAQEARIAASVERIKVTTRRVRIMNPIPDDEYISNYWPLSVDLASSLTSTVEAAIASAVEGVR